MADFHFLRPWWLLALLPVLLVGWQLLRQHRQHSGWQHVVAPHLLAWLSPPLNERQRQWPLRLLVISTLIGCIALAGPTWQRLPQPVYQLEAGQVVIMDMSMSMRSTDISPNRLTQQRFKAIDLVKSHLDGEIGLIAYAGDAFIVSPLTADANNLTNLIRALSPEIMPEQGSHPLAALQLADRLLTEAGYAEGDIYWLTDGIQTTDQQSIIEFLRNHNHRVSILGIGTSAGAPIQLTDGSLLRDRSGQVVVPQLLTDPLERFSSMTQGRFSVIRTDQADLEYLTDLAPIERSGSETDDQAGDQWRDQGPWLVLMVILAALCGARRGILPKVLPVLLTVCLISPVQAQTTESSQAVNEPGLAWHEQLFATPYQQADQALQAGAYERAQAISEDSWQRGEANYRAGNYAAALSDFSQRTDAIGFYNQGNALMQLQRYEEAVGAYQAALQQQPEWTAAQENYELAKELAEQQDDQQSQQGEQGEQQQQSEQAEGEQQESEQQQQSEENDTESKDDAQQEQPEPQNEKQSDAEAEAEAEPQAALPQGDLTEEQRQQMEQWLNRIQDDPAVLLRNKMRLEAQRRDQNKLPRGVEQEW
ncbi:MAG TPA: VWA domain-containing protein [Pseudidiomarina sp.]|nr:VWA domain-containing protein [Pseudidiomarina sp.]